MRPIEYKQNIFFLERTPDDPPEPLPPGETTGLGAIGLYLSIILSTLDISSYLAIQHPPLPFITLAFSLTHKFTNISLSISLYNFWCRGLKREGW